MFMQHYLYSFDKNFVMPSIKKTTPAEETKEQRIKKELAYIQRQFPWKTATEISATYTEYGRLTPGILKKWTTPKSTLEYAED